MAKFWAVPVRENGTEICGTTSQVLVDGKYTVVNTFVGDYQSSGNFIRYVLSKYAVPGVTYNIRKSYGGGATSDIIRVFTRS